MQLKRIKSEATRRPQSLRPNSMASYHIKSPSNMTTLQSFTEKPLDLEVKGVPAEKANGAKTVMMKRYLSSWQQGHTALTTNWHN